MKKTIGCLVVIGAMGFSGCAGTTAGLDAERRLTAVQENDLDDTVRKAILNGRVMVGMTEGMVAASWGLPHSVRSSVSDGWESWSYGSRFTPGWETTLIFEDGTVVDVHRIPVRGVSDLWDRSIEVRSADPHTEVRPERSPLEP
jgi:hypothetical protein